MKRLTARDDKGNLLFSGKQVYAGDFYEAASCLEEYEDTGLTPEQIRELKERDTAKAPKICKNKHSDAYTCPNCALALINKDETGLFCGKHYKFCPDCGQRIKLEE